MARLAMYYAVIVAIVHFPVLATGSTHAVTSLLTADLPTIDCSLDDDSTNPTLEYCLGVAEDFAERYEKFLKKGKKFNRCIEFQQFHDCMSPLLNECPLIRTTLDRKWKNIYEVMTCACNPNAPECSDNLDCMEAEHKSIYINLCQELYDFNLAQSTHSKCRFLREKLDCEASLVASACGEPVSQFFSSLVKVLPKKLKCYAPTMSHRYQPQAFRYTPHCPRNITEKIQQCSRLHPVDSILHFHKDNDLIVEDNRKQLKNSCLSFVEYQSCFNEIKAECSDGVDRILDYNGNMRSYMIKMDYICNQARRPYLDNMYCYQEVLANDSFSTCNHVWEGLIDNLYNLTAYEYYCTPYDTRSRDMRMSLKALEGCYESVLKSQCNIEASKTMAQLISIAFQDPYYLRYSFKPDCRLHNPDPPDTTPPTAISSTTERLLASSQRIRNSPVTAPPSSANSISVNIHSISVNIHSLAVFSVIIATILQSHLIPYS